MSDNAGSVRIIARSSPPDVPRLRAVANELRRRVPLHLRRTKPRPEAEATDLGAKSLVALFREALEALGPESRKLYLAGKRGSC